MGTGRGLIGTSGWSYAHWAKGRFYPRGLAQRDRLAHYARRFRTVEVNATFYRLPRPEYVERWLEITGGRFRFAVKLSRRITHQMQLAGCDEELGRFFEVVSGFGRKRGPLLVQLPPYLSVDPRLLDDFLRALKSNMGKPRWRVVVEFRNDDWLCKDVLEILDRRRAALCLSDMPRCTTEKPNDVDFVYVRRHGVGRYSGSYPPAALEKDAGRVRGWLSRGRDVYVYFNNDLGGHAVDNARDLAERVGT
jgi:uncharacterized protein YecE (DUF72 family)